MRLAFGAVAPRPWRARIAEDAIRGGPVTRDAFAAALADEFAAAEPLPGNAFKVPLAQNLGVAVLSELAGIAADAAVCRTRTWLATAAPLRGMTGRADHDHPGDAHPDAPGRGPGKGDRQRASTPPNTRPTTWSTPGRCCRPSPPGRVTDVDTATALAVPGVLRVWWHGNAPLLADVGMPMLAVLQSPEVHFRGEVVALVAATSPEVAREAAAHLQVTYVEREHQSVLAGGRPVPADAGRGECRLSGREREGRRGSGFRWQRGADRCDLHDPRLAQQSDGAARDDRRLSPAVSSPSMTPTRAAIRSGRPSPARSACRWNGSG